MARLARANGCAGAEAGLGAPAMSNHLDQPGTAHAMRLCAGWLAVIGRDHLGIRMSVIAGLPPADALLIGEDWPALHHDLDGLLAARNRSDQHTTTC